MSPAFRAELLAFYAERGSRRKWLWGHWTQFLDEGIWQDFDTFMPGRKDVRL